MNETNWLYTHYVLLLKLCFFSCKQQKSNLIGRVPLEMSSGPIKRGLLWQQRDRLFSRWKER